MKINKYYSNLKHFNKTSYGIKNEMFHSQHADVFADTRKAHDPLMVYISTAHKQTEDKPR